MIVSFELTMPNRGSWNGRWSGEDNKYYVIKKFSGKQAKEVTEKLFKNTPTSANLEVMRNSWYYRWEDGWGANVTAEVIDATLARKRRKVSKGFCSYEWMIGSILKYGAIYASHEEIPAELVGN